MEDMLVVFIKTGKLNFKDFVNSVADDLLRLIIKMGISKLSQWFQLMLGGASGGAAPSGVGGVFGNVMSWASTGMAAYRAGSGLSPRSPSVTHVTSLHIFFSQITVGTGEQRTGEQRRRECGDSRHEA